MCGNTKCRPLKSASVLSRIWCLASSLCVIALLLLRRRLHQTDLPWPIDQVVVRSGTLGAQHVDSKIHPLHTVCCHSDKGRHIWMLSAIVLAVVQVSSSESDPSRHNVWEEPAQCWTSVIIVDKSHGGPQRTGWGWIKASNTN